MSISAADLIVYADWLHAAALGNEAHQRTTVSKSYYAAFHDSLNWHAALTSPGALTPNASNGMHDQLCQRLSNPTVTAVKMTSKKRAYALRALHEKRVIADYKLAYAVSTDDAAQALADAKLILSII